MQKLILIFSLFISVNCFAAGGGTKTIIENGTGNYTSVIAWESGENSDLQQTAYGVISGTWTNREIAVLSINGFTTYPTAYIDISATGTAKAGKTVSNTVWRVNATAGRAVDVYESNVRFDGLQINPEIYSKYTTGIIGLYFNHDTVTRPADYRISNCLIVDSSYTSVSSLGLPSTAIYTEANSSITFRVYNNKFYNWGQGITGAWASYVSTYVFYNNTFFRCDKSTQTSEGIIGCIAIRNLGRFFAKNNIIVGSTKCFNNDGSIVMTSTKNLTSDQTSPDAELRGLNPNFVNTTIGNNTDLTIVSPDTTTINMGMNLTTDPNSYQNITTDYDGQSRASAGTQNWTIGADEYVYLGGRRRTTYTIYKD